MLKDFFQSALGRIYLVALVVIVLGVYALSDLKQQTLQKEMRQQLSSVHLMIKRSANHQLNQLEAMFKILGQRLVEAGGIAGGDATYRVMDSLLRDNPVLVAYGLARPDGQIVYASENIRRKQLPNLATASGSAQSFYETLQSNRLMLGNTYFFKPLGIYLVPIRYAVRNARGEVEMVITSALDIKGEFRLWNIEDLGGEIGISVTTSRYGNGEYYPIYYDPHEVIAATEAEAYANPVPERFINTVDQRMTEEYGLGLDAAEQDGRLYSILNDTKGVEAHYVLLSFDPQFRYFLALKQSLAQVGGRFNESLQVYIISALAILVSLFITLFQIFKSDREYRHHLRHQALHDPLTGLPNRYFLKEKYTAWRQAQPGRIALLYLDLDNFKFINDHFGHTVGDRVLVDVAKRLKPKLGEAMQLIRQGGDEFILLSPYTQRNRLEVFVEQLLYALNEVMVINDIRLSITGSIGVAVTDETEDLDSLLVNADVAMYEAKKLKNQFAFYSSHMQEQTEQRVLIENGLHDALGRDELFLEYQPQIDAKLGHIHGVEALLRWESPTLGRVGPDQFIPVAEASGLINAIGERVMELAFQEMAPLLQRFSQFTLSINVSVHQLIYGAFRNNLLMRARRYGIAPERIVVEVTESLFIEDFKQIDNLLRQLRADGVNISLDDFGTGYSSLSLIRSLPINEIKVDKSFVRDILIDDNDRALIRSIIGIGESQGIPIVAEGVEEQAQVKMLCEYGCRVFQGYFFTRPMRSDLLQTYLSEFDFKQAMPD